jgi:cob(I)alamin adenosyltransferase
MSSISTTLGDKGETSLLSGERVPKDHPRVEAVGDLDELEACLGGAKCAAAKSKTGEIIETVQNQLMELMGALTRSAAGAKAKETYPALEAAEARINEWVAEFEAGYPMNGFILPGATPADAKLDLARVVCRRAERRVVSLDRLEPVSPVVLRYLNRLSDLMFLLEKYEADTASR